ncbi:hypothetical protein, partial [Barnesiella viscericola]|uniref:hypothetical protein n=1 Tax=Barnesiella viscericola TaxID=397865 RepID=UPI0024B774D5
EQWQMENGVFKIDRAEPPLFFWKDSERREPRQTKTEISSLTGPSRRVIFREEFGRDDFLYLYLRRH